MNALIGAGVGILGTLGLSAAGYELWKHHHLKKLAEGKATIPAGTSLDTGMDTYTASVVSAALAKETDTSILDSLAKNLRAAGFPNSADAISKRSDVVKGALKNPTPVTTATKGLVTGVAGLFGVGASGCGGDCDCGPCKEAHQHVSGYPEMFPIW